MPSDLHNPELAVNFLAETRKFLVHCKNEFNTYKHELMQDDPMIVRLKSLEQLLDRMMNIYPPSGELYQMAYAYSAQVRYCRHCFSKNPTGDLLVDPSHTPVIDN